MQVSKNLPDSIRKHQYLEGWPENVTQKALAEFAPNTVAWFPAVLCVNKARSGSILSPFVFHHINTPIV